MSSFRIGVKYGIVKRMVKGFKVEFEEEVLRDLRFVIEELLDSLIVASPSNFEEFVKVVNDWLSLEAKVYGFECKVYRLGRAKKIFERVVFERVLFTHKDNKLS